MGFSHGGVLRGVLLAYMFVMVAVEAMSIPVVVALAGLIAVEKVILRGTAWCARGVALGFVLLGFVVFTPRVS
jgi:hypothetical protein